MCVCVGNSPITVRAASMCDPPTNVNARALSPTSINVTWDQPTLTDTNTTISYNVIYDANVNFVSEATITTNDITVILTALEEGIIYTITVQTVCDGVPGDSNQANTRTQAAG